MRGGNVASGEKKDTRVCHVIHILNCRDSHPEDYARACEFSAQLAMKLSSSSNAGWLLEEESGLKKVDIGAKVFPELRPVPRVARQVVQAFFSSGVQRHRSE